MWVRCLHMHHVVSITTTDKISKSVEILKFASSGRLLSWPGISNAMKPIHM